MSSELRQDIVSGDWMIIAPGRAARPHFLDEKKPARKPSPVATCPFENPEKNGNWPPIAAYPNEKKWKILVIPNKYPALIEEHKDVCSALYHEGIYAARTGIGEHDLVVTRDHRKNFAEIAPATAAEVLRIFQMLCKRAAEDECTTFAVPFFNWGQLAGASLWHPHYQFLSLPIVPMHSARSFRGAEAYRAEHHVCARCEIVRFERKEGKRVIEENADAIVLAPFASKFPFEISIVPKTHAPFFYQTSPRVIRSVAQLLQSTLRRMKKYLNDPDLNVFIHEGLLDGKKHAYHHWHIEIVPRVSTPAGFELSTGIYINTAAPEDAAKILRGK